MRTWPRTMTGCRGDSNKDERARAQVLHEMERRDAEAEKTREHAKFSRQLEQAEAVENAYVHAEAATRGNMLNAKSRARGINPRTLLTSREETFRRYASEELMSTTRRTICRPPRLSAARTRGCIRWPPNETPPVGVATTGGARWVRR